MADPLKDIEDRQAAIDLGVLYYRVYLGARSDGASRYDAFLTTAALFYASMKSGFDETEEGGD